MLVIQTEYPGGIYKIETNKKSFVIYVKNGDPYKITLAEQYKFMFDLLTKSKSRKFIDGKILFKNCFVCLEDFRNIHCGLISNLIQDNKQPSNKKIGSFGFLCGNTKKYRLKYINYCKQYSDVLDYISTPKYSKTDPNMISFIDMKHYKYLIDLPGHTYSTKMYSFLHSKRVVFKIKGVNTQHEFYWEKKLIPNIHYIEIEPDYSDLLLKYHFLESNPLLYSKIVENCEDLIRTDLSQEKLINHFIECISQ